MAAGMEPSWTSAKTPIDITRSLASAAQHLCQCVSSSSNGGAGSTALVVCRATRLWVTAATEAAKALAEMCNRSSGSGSGVAALPTGGTDAVPPSAAVSAAAVADESTDEEDGDDVNSSNSNTRGVAAAWAALDAAWTAGSSAIEAAAGGVSLVLPVRHSIRVIAARVRDAEKWRAAARASAAATTAAATAAAAACRFEGGGGLFNFSSEIASVAASVSAARADLLNALGDPFALWQNAENEGNEDFFSKAGEKWIAADVAAGAVAAACASRAVGAAAGAAVEGEGSGATLCAVFWGLAHLTLKYDAVAQAVAPAQAIALLRESAELESIISAAQRGAGAVTEGVSTLVVSEVRAT